METRTLECSDSLGNQCSHYFAFSQRLEITFFNHPVPLSPISRTTLHCLRFVCAVSSKVLVDPASHFLESFSSLGHAGLPLICYQVLCQCLGGSHRISSLDPFPSRRVKPRSVNLGTAVENIGSAPLVFSNTGYACLYFVGAKVSSRTPRID